MTASPHTRQYWESQQNGGFEAYPLRTTNRPFIPEKSTTVKVKQGQVLKARSFVEISSVQTATDYPQVEALHNIVEIAEVTFATNLADTKTLEIAGLTITATGGAVTPAQVVEILTTQTSVGFGVLTGTLTNWLIEVGKTPTSIVAYSTSVETNVTDLTVTIASGGNMTATVVTDATVASWYRKKAFGILAMDVDATSSDVVTSVYTEAKAYESEIVWYVDTAVDTITKSDGTTVACTAYNTGAFSKALRQQVAAHTEFEIVTPTAGEELANG